MLQSSRHQGESEGGANKTLLFIANTTEDTRHRRSRSVRIAQKEVDHLARVLKQNGYPANFIRDASTPPMQETADTSGRDEE